MNGPASQQAHSIVTPSVLVIDQGKGTSDKAVWTNTLGFPIYVYKGYVWCGVSKGVIADISVWLTSPNDVLVVTNDDHYEDRGAIMANHIDFDASPGWYLVNQGDIVTLSLTVVGYPTGVAQSFALIRYWQ